MIFESLAVIAVALSLDFVFGDPKSRYHPTAWIGNFVARVTTLLKGRFSNERLGGIFAVLAVVGGVCLSAFFAEHAIKLLLEYGVFFFVLGIVGAAVLLKMTIAIRGMEKHAMAVIASVENNDLSSARSNLSMIVKRKTGNLDKDHVLSGVVESIGENIVDGITGPLFYYSLFGITGAFAYRAVNTIDSMIGYKTDIFSKFGWFGANCDKILNFVPARLTAANIVLASALLKKNWKNSYRVMMRDAAKTLSPNAGYPMAAIAGALDVRLEKVNHYSLGDGTAVFEKSHVVEAVKIMKLSTVLFFASVLVPVVVVLSFAGVGV